MNHTPDTTTTAENGGNFDPQQAAALLRPDHPAGAAPP